MLKNIFWDVDGVLADLNLAYFNFLRGHPSYKEKYADLKWDDLPGALPIDEKYGGLELSCHPTSGARMNKDFNESEFFDKRPLYPHARDIILKLHESGYNQATMSATGAPARKTALLRRILGGLPIEIKITPHGDEKEENMRRFMESRNWSPAETALIDDRLYNIRAAIRAGVHPIRMRSEFTTDAPPDLRHVPEVRDIREIPELLKKIGAKEPL